MTSATYSSRGLSEKLVTKSRRLGKWLRWHLNFSQGIKPRVLLIVGSQRSGTSLLNRILDRDLRTSVLSEDNCLTGTSESRLRLKPFDEVNQHLAEFRTPLVVFKPLVESQNTTNMLDNIADSKALWMLRNYADVVNSDVNRFGSQVRNLKAVVDREPGNWRSEHVSDETRTTVSTHYSDDMSRYDAAALMWYVRNTLFFEAALDADPRVLLCRYEDLVADPRRATASIYSFIGLDYPKRDIVAEVHADSFGLGRDVPLNADIRDLCDELQCRMQEACRSQTSAGDLTVTEKARTTE